MTAVCADRGQFPAGYFLPSPTILKAIRHFYPMEEKSCEY